MPKRNPFEKFLKKEDHLQIQLSRWLRYQYPNVIWLHPQNEGRRSPFERYLYKQLGCLTGASDMLIFEAKGSYHGLAIELKVGNNKPTPRQQEFITTMREKGWWADVVWEFDAAVQLIDWYMKLREI
jgi:hypothetical protein